MKLRRLFLLADRPGTPALSRYQLVIVPFTP
jgi:hypothetical protein